MPVADARFAFDLGGACDLGPPLRLGLAFNHLSFRQRNPVLEITQSFEVSDVSVFARLDARRRRAIPYLAASAGLYFADTGERGDILRAAGGVEVPVAIGLAAVEARVSSYASGAFIDEVPGGRPWALELRFGFRLPLRRGGAASEVEELSRKDRARIIVRYIATPEELAELESLSSDEAVDAFMEAFWARRNPYPEAPGNPVREEHMFRLGVAASRYREAGQPGWTSDRGRILIVYGEPAEVLWESRVPRASAFDPHVPGDRGTAASYALWIYDRRLPKTDGRQSFFLFEEDAVSRFRLAWTNVRGEVGYGRPLPPLPLTLERSLEGGL
jgi:GWxTD domain-containing protein